MLNSEHQSFDVPKQRENESCHYSESQSAQHKTKTEVQPASGTAARDCNLPAVQSWAITWCLRMPKNGENDVYLCNMTVTMTRELIHLFIHSTHI